MLCLHRGSECVMRSECSCMLGSYASQQHIIFHHFVRKRQSTRVHIEAKNESVRRKSWLDFDWQALVLAEPLSLPVGRRWAVGQSPSALLRTAGFHWSAGSAWSPEETSEEGETVRGAQKRECHDSGDRKQGEDGKITISILQLTPAESKQWTLISRTLGERRGSKGGRKKREVEGRKLTNGREQRRKTWMAKAAT